MLVSGVARADAGEVDVFVSNDQRAENGGTLRWCATDLAGATLGGGEEPWWAAAQTSAKLKTLALKPVLDAHGGANHVLVWLEATDAAGAGVVVGPRDVCSAQGLGTGAAADRR